MDNGNEMRDFLVSRRAKITPDQAGLPAYGAGSRRVAGLRREEVALLATWAATLEQADHDPGTMMR